MASRRISGTVRRERGRPCSWGSSHARALIATTTLGGKERWTTAPLSLFEAAEALFKEAFAPLADDLSWRVQTGSDFVVSEALCGVEHDPSSDDVSIR